MHKTKVFAAAVFALLLAAACGSSGSNYPIFGGGNSNQAYDIHGTVDSIDLNSQSIYLTNVSGYNNSLAGTGGYGNTVRVYYDNRTSINYQGRNYRPEDLERGDQVTVHVNSSGNQLMAQSMDVTYDSRGGMASSSSIPSYGNGSVLTGTVRSIDTYRHTMSVDPGYGSYVTVDWTGNTPVYYNGRTYAPGDIEVGDQVNVRIGSGGSGRVSAQDITVTRSISGNNNGAYSSTNMQTVRGTVRSIDTYNHTIELESTQWMNGFQTSTGGNTLLIHYDTTSRVNVSGQLYPLSNLERGDVIDVQLQPNGSTNYLAQTITLVRDVRSR
jgi:predicted RNA-binding protein